MEELEVEVNTESFHIINSQLASYPISRVQRILEMKKSLKSKNSKDIGRGPIARKVIASGQHHLQKKLTNLSDWREAKIRAENFQKTIISPNELTQYDPVHGLYIYGQNQLSVLIEQIIELPMVEKLVDAYAEAQEEYMPSGPPMSPLTTSYFTSWGSFDLCSGGAKKETFGTIAIDFCKFLNIDEGLINLFEKMQASRMGIFKHEGTSDNHLFLRELITNREIKAISPSGYLGNRDEIWLARVLPPPFDNELFKYSIVFTTPYVLGKIGSSREFIPFVERDWLAYFERNLSQTKIDEKELAYEHLMKYGLSRNYWNEYIFLSYRNHRHDLILLEGFPDILSSLPHFQEGKEKLGL